MITGPLAAVNQLILSSHLVTRDVDDEDDDDDEDEDDHDDDKFMNDSREVIR